MARTALILGPSGRFGRQASTALERKGWSLRRFDRRSDDLMQAARGADLIVNAWNPPYPEWQATVPRLTDAVIRAAEAHGATLVVPGNVYVFGADAPELFAADTPHRATNTLGRVRIAMEEAYRRADTQVIVLRGGDFLDTEASGNWFDRILAKDLASGRFVYPGDPDVAHAWAFLPDMARACAELADIRETLPRHADIPYPGYTLTGSDLAALCARALGRDLRVTPMSWLPIRLASPVWKTGRHLLEMRYLWSKPHRLDAACLARLLPDFRQTPVEDAVAAAVAPLMAAAPDRPRPAHAPLPLQPDR